MRKRTDSPQLDYLYIISGRLGKGLNFLPGIPSLFTCVVISVVCCLSYLIIILIIVIIMTFCAYLSIQLSHRKDNKVLNIDTVAKILME